MGNAEYEEGMRPPGSGVNFTGLYDLEYAELMKRIGQKHGVRVKVEATAGKPYKVEAHTYQREIMVTRHTSVVRPETVPERTLTVPKGYVWVRVTSDDKHISDFWKAFNEAQKQAQG